MAEHALSKRKVASSILAGGSLHIRHGVVGNISACHADARGSIPRDGVVLLFVKKLFLVFVIGALVARPPTYNGASMPRWRSWQRVGLIILRSRVRSSSGAVNLFFAFRVFLRAVRTPRQASSRDARASVGWPSGPRR